MAAAAMVAHCEVIASGCSTVGEPYGETPLSVSRCRSPGASKPVLGADLPHPDGGRRDRRRITQVGSA
jgi:hypothetical protein